MYDARQIANEFIRRSCELKRPLTPMHIQKLVYFAHARMLHLHRRPLIRQTFEAWTYGPVVFDLYRSLSMYGGGNVKNLVPLKTEELIGTRESGIIDRTFDTYGHLNAIELSDLTHEDDAPWARAKTKNRVRIPNDTIEKYFSNAWSRESRKTLRRMHNNPEIRAKVAEGLSQIDSGQYETWNQDETSRPK